MSNIGGFTFNVGDRFDFVDDLIGFYGGKDYGVTGRSYLHDFSIDGKEEYIETLIQTRPIMLDSNNPKSSYRVVLRGLFYGNPSKKSGLYVMGSLDGERWMYLGGTERGYNAGVPIRDIGTTIERYSCKMLMVVFVGSLSPKSKIDNFEITVNEKYNDKIR